MLFFSHSTFKHFQGKSDWMSNPTYLFQVNLIEYFHVTTIFKTHWPVQAVCRTHKKYSSKIIHTRQGGDSMFSITMWFGKSKHSWIRMGLDQKMPHSIHLQGSTSLDLMVKTKFQAERQHLADLVGDAQWGDCRITTVEVDELGGKKFKQGQEPWNEQESPFL